MRTTHTRIRGLWLDERRGLSWTHRSLIMVVSSADFLVFVGGWKTVDTKVALVFVIGLATAVRALPDLIEDSAVGLRRLRKTSGCERDASKRHAISSSSSSS